MTDDAAPIATEVDAVEQLAFDLDQQLGLNSNSNYFENWGGLNEKWLHSDSGDWVFVTPSGAAFLWDGNQDLGTSELLATLDETYHADPTKLSDAPQPTVTETPSVLVTTWSKVSGPGEVAFGDAAAVDTTVSFGTEGTYVLELAAHDGEFATTDQVLVTVNTAAEPPSVVYVSDLPFAQAPTNGWGPVERDASNGERAAGDGNQITINGVTYDKGLGVHASSEVVFDLAGDFDRFVSDVGVDDEVSSHGSVTFQVWGDGTKLFDSGAMNFDSPAQSVDVGVAEIRQLRLIVTDGGNGKNSDHADWADARLVGASSVNPAPAGTPANEPRFVYASDLPFALQPVNGWGPVERDTSNGEQHAGDGNPITIGGVTYDKGLGAHAGSEVTFDLAGYFSRFAADIGVDDEVTANGSVTFEVWGDGTKLFDSGLMTVASPAQSVDVNVSGMNQLKLIVTDGGNGKTSDHADWADARLVMATDGANRAPLVNAGPDQRVLLSTPVTLDATVLDDSRPNSPGTVLTTWNKVSGPGNVTFGDIATIDTTATFSQAGTYELRLEADDGELTASDLVTIVVIDNQQELTGFFVSPTGSAAGDGSSENPWDLRTAFSHPAAVKPGDTIWLRGGTYRGGFNSTLTGTADKPIIVRAVPGEHVTIDLRHGSDFFVRGDYTHYWGFEVTDTDPSTRISSQSGSSPSDISEGKFFSYGDHNKFINLVIHDLVGNGLGFWASGEGGEIYGSVIYNNGWIGPDRPHGHGIYTQNTRGTKDIVDNVIFSSLRNGIKIYAEGSPLSGYHVEGNSVFNARAYEILVGGKHAISDITLANNFTYDHEFDGTIELNYFFGPKNNDIRITDNYFANSIRLWKGWQELTFTGNSVVTGPKQAVSMASSGAYEWDNNRYLAAASKPFSYRGNSQTWNQWRAATGFDANSEFVAGGPAGVEVFVRPNRYEEGRANVTVYNWDNNASADIDLSSVLSVGATYEIHHVFDLFGAPVVSGTYDGRTIRLPMAARTSPRPTGGNQLGDPVGTGSDFGVFLVTTVTPSQAQIIAEDAGTQNKASVEKLTDEALDPIVDYAIKQWVDSGLTSLQVELLENIEVRIGDLDYPKLGEATANTITLDDDAAGFGWFVDSTPNRDEEFTASPDRGLLATDGSSAAGRIDLLTVVMHELGHISGHAHGDTLVESVDLMDRALASGVRRRLDVHGVDAVLGTDF